MRNWMYAVAYCHCKFVTAEKDENLCNFIISPIISPKFCGKIYFVMGLT